jgi:O-antigen ligase
MSNSDAHPVVSISDVLGRLQNKLALLFLLLSAAPALYIAPVILILFFVVAWVRIPILLISGKFTNIVFPKYNLFALLILLYCIFNAMLTGLEINNIFNYEAIRYDANIFYAFIPFLVISSKTVKLSEIDKWVRSISILSSVAYLVSTVMSFPLFESHNAAGGYFMVLMAYVLGRVAIDDRNAWGLPLLLLLFALIASDSRGSLFAVMGVWITFKAINHFPRLSKVLLLSGIVVMISLLAYAYKFWHDNGSVYLYDYSSFQSETDGIDFEGLLLGERPGTILHRLFYLYPMSIDMFLHSPLFGVGFTRFDDYPFQYANVADFLSMNITDSVQHTNFHAHNSYFHILAELGLVGFGFFYILIRGIFLSFRSDRKTGSPVRFMLSALLVASFTEHRFTTPSQAAPVFLMISILWGCRHSRGL